MATHSSILAWRIPWMVEPGGLQSMGLQRVRQDWATYIFTFKSLLEILQVIFHFHSVPTPVLLLASSTYFFSSKCSLNINILLDSRHTLLIFLLKTLPKRAPVSIIFSDNLYVDDAQFNISSWTWAVSSSTHSQLCTRHIQVNISHASCSRYWQASLKCNGVKQLLYEAHRFCGSGFQRWHHRDSWSVMRYVRDLYWEESRLGQLVSFDMELSRCFHSHIWWLMFLLAGTSAGLLSRWPAQGISMWSL